MELLFALWGVFLTVGLALIAWDCRQRAKGGRRASEALARLRKEMARHGG